MVDNFGSCFGLKATFPGRDKGCSTNHLARGINETDVFEDLVGDGIERGVGHKIINADCAGIGKY